MWIVLRLRFPSSSSSNMYEATKLAWSIKRGMKGWHGFVIFVVAKQTKHTPSAQQLGWSNWDAPSLLWAAIDVRSIPSIGRGKRSCNKHKMKNSACNRCNGGKGWEGKVRVQRIDAAQLCLQMTILENIRRYFKKFQARTKKQHSASHSLSYLPGCCSNTAEASGVSGGDVVIVTNVDASLSSLPPSFCFKIPALLFFCHCPTSPSPRMHVNKRRNTKIAEPKGSVFELQFSTVIDEHQVSFSYSSLPFL